MNWIELFAGGGGAATGLIASGHTVKVAIEKDDRIALCYQRNHPQTRVIAADVRDVSLSSLPATINALWASPVCKQDSLARCKALPQREDATIGLAIIPYIRAINPDLVIIENVPRYQKNPTLTTLISFLTTVMHYTIGMRVLDAANYGVPQHRERLFIQARRGPIAWPDYAPCHISWYEALVDLLDKMTPADLAPWQQALWKPEYTAMLPIMVHGHYHYRDTDEARQLDVLPSHLPARTVTASHNSTQKRIVLADGRIIRTTPRAAARLQTFPDTYIFPSQSTLASAIIGNAVPPLLVQRLCEVYASMEVAA